MYDARNQTRQARLTFDNILTGHRLGRKVSIIILKYVDSYWSTFISIYDIEFKL